MLELGISLRRTRCFVAYSILYQAHNKRADLVLLIKAPVPTTASFCSNVRPCVYPGGEVAVYLSAYAARQ